MIPKGMTLEELEERASHPVTRQFFRELYWTLYELALRVESLEKENQILKDQVSSGQVETVP